MELTNLEEYRIDLVQSLHTYADDLDWEQTSRGDDIAYTAKSVLRNPWTITVIRGHNASHVDVELSFDNGPILKDEFISALLPEQEQEFLHHIYETASNIAANRNDAQRSISEDMHNLFATKREQTQTR